MIGAVSLLPVLAGCGASNPLRGVLSRDIGPAPAYLQPVAMPQPAPQKSAVVLAEERGDALDRANAIIVCANADHGATRQTFLQGERPVDAAPAGECPALDDAKAKIAAKGKPVKVAKAKPAAKAAAPAKR
jgi:hypothetical protein